ncbi:hypothetical protein M3P05_19785 [Sansalvadorimonas sp. 2012CJ34-2]|uniref:Transposase n=1 Tax=Parendozoicomonas callyspongiae TaxID=2942213 RepID=A0ABT0PLN2_9GAMM|nr:hypothetical protein [Sansalvadorimonas sp. 2012CJ34-2]MCL6272166.1 hypothetical protein [Sansalvadorimonas sp. 2012CJ34-2]
MKNSSATLREYTQNCLHQMAQCADEPLSTVLTEEDLLNFQQRGTGRVRNYPAEKTLSLFLRQVASEEKSCRKVLIADAADQTALNNMRLTTHNSAYCKARQRLDEHDVKALFQLSGQRFDEASPERWLWHNRRVVLVDGSTLSMPDTSTNQPEYPQPSTQKKRSAFRF